MLCAALTSSIAIKSLPLEHHEVLVLQTAKEMQQSGDWIVPRFNGTPRLNKPPLSYWLTAAVSHLFPGRFQVLNWHGRLVSSISSLIMTAISVSIGHRLFSRRSGLLAGAICATSFGFLSYSHNARPDFLFAALLNVAMLGFIVAWKARDRSPKQWIGAMTMWASFGLATLAKGPHIAIILLAAWVTFLLRDPSQRPRLLRTIRPMPGLILFFAVAAPWWILVDRHLRASGLSGLQDTQLSGSLFAFDVRPLLRLYYIQYLLQYLLPWILLVPMAFLLPWRDDRIGDSARMLRWTVVSILLVMSVFSHPRHHYVLPILPSVVVLMGGGTATLWRAIELSATSPAWWRRIGWINAGIAMTILGVMVCKSIIYDIRPLLPLWLALIASTVILAIAIMTRKRLQDFSATPLILSFTMFFLLALGVEASHSLWGPNQARRESFARQVGRYADHPDKPQGTEEVFAEKNGIDLTLGGFFQECVSWNESRNSCPIVFKYIAVQPL